MSTKFWAVVAFVAIILVAVSGCSEQPMSSDVISQNDVYTVTGDSVIQGDFVAVAVSPLEIVSNFKPDEITDTSAIYQFRLAINARDNEFLAEDASHYAIMGSDSVIEYGVAQARPTSTPKIQTISTKWTLRINVGKILDGFKNKGFFATETGDTIYAEDFKGIWISGENVKLHQSRMCDSIYEAQIDKTPNVRTIPNSYNWKIEEVNQEYPQYSSQDVLVDALYNMSIDKIASYVKEAKKAKEKDLSTSIISYSSYLAMAYLDPIFAMKCLKAKVKNGRIVQDSGLGGAWPVTSDRVVWAVAAWEVYKVLGDKEWLRYAYEVVRNSVEDDRLVLLDPSLQLMHGMRSFAGDEMMSYPKWMQPKDVFESMSLSTNVLFAQTFYILSDMGDELDVDTDYLEMAKRLKDAINQNLWQESKGYYSAYLYGGIYPIKSPTIDNLGQALSVIFDIADDGRDENLIGHTPVTPFGMMGSYPLSREDRAFDVEVNNTLLQALWNIAASKVDNENVLRRGLGAMYRYSALYGAKQNWQRSGAIGNVAMIFKVFAGMEFQTGGIEFNPMIPICFGGAKKITGFHYRKATLDISIYGTGNEIAEIRIDGVKTEDNFFSATMEGRHAIDITMKEGRRLSQKANICNIGYMPSTPVLIHNDGYDSILNAVKGLRYSVVINGKSGYLTGDVKFNHPEGEAYQQISVIPCDKNVCGFMSRPHSFIPGGTVWMYQCEDFAEGGTNLIKGGSAEKFIEISSTKNIDVSIPIIVPTAGTYYIDVRYANGNGPVDGGNKCAVRMLFVNTHLQGAIVMPQRGDGEWLNTGFSNMVKAELLSGKNVLQLMYVAPSCTNMDSGENKALIDYIRVMKK